MSSCQTLDLGRSCESVVRHMTGHVACDTCNLDDVQAMSEVAQRMQLRHPNIATVMGVATEPVTEDPLLVSHLFFGGGGGRTLLPHVCTVKRATL